LAARLDAQPCLISSVGPVDAGVHGFLSALYFSAVSRRSGAAISCRSAARVSLCSKASRFDSVRLRDLGSSPGQEQLIGEIHHIAFEDRLGHVAEPAARPDRAAGHRAV
jgi:hypothetical protein